MSDSRRNYQIRVTINNRHFEWAVIDPHYEQKHPDMTDEIILSLIMELDGSKIDPVGYSDGFTYLAPELVWKTKQYRLVLTYCDEDFVGVINAFRVKEKKL